MHVFADMPDPVMQAIKLLAVIGGITIGAIAFDLLLRLIVRRFTSKSVPRPARILTRIAGGALLGGLVWLWVFGSGQGGFGGSGGGYWPFGQGGAGKGDGGGADKDKGGADKDKQTTVKGKVDPLQVHILGGKRVINDRFYVIESESPRTLSETRDAIRERKSKQQGLKEIEILIYTDSVDRDNPAVTELEKWVRDQDLTPKLTLPDRKAP